MGDTPETADYTLAQQRIREMKSGTANRIQAPEPFPTAIPRLLPFTASMDDYTGLAFALDTYLKLLDWSGRAFHLAKKRQNTR